MTDQSSKLACFYIGFNGDFRGVCRLVLVTVECSVNQAALLGGPGSLRDLAPLGSGTQGPGAPSTFDAAQVC